MHSLLRGQRDVHAAVFRERALLHHPVRCADNRNVILSRRVCGASKNLLSPPKSSYNAIMPMLRPHCHFDRGEKHGDERSGEISHIVRMLLQ